MDITIICFSLFSTRVGAALASDRIEAAMEIELRKCMFVVEVVVEM
jgi:hypothetical protein